MVKREVQSKLDREEYWNERVEAIVAQLSTALERTKLDSRAIQTASNNSIPRLMIMRAAMVQIMTKVRG